VESPSAIAAGLYKGIKNSAVLRLTNLLDKPKTAEFLNWEHNIFFTSILGENLYRDYLEIGALWVRGEIP